MKRDEIRDSARIKFHSQRELETNEHDFAFLDGYDAGQANSRQTDLLDRIAERVRQMDPDSLDDPDIGFGFDSGYIMAKDMVLEILEAMKREQSEAK